MDLTFLDKKSYQNIMMYPKKIQEKEHLPFYIKLLSGKNPAPVPHRHEYVQINYVVKGNGIHTINHASVSVSRGDIFVVPPYVPHSISSKQTGEIMWYELEFDAELLTGESPWEDPLGYECLEPYLKPEELVAPKFHLQGKSQIQTEAILEEILAEYEERGQHYIAAAKALLMQLLVVIRRGGNGEKTEVSFNHDLSEAISYIEWNFERQLTVKEVAKQIGYSPSYFSTIFKNYTQKTFTDYVNGMRISKAMLLLCTTSMRIIEIAYDCGFHTVTHFNKVFKDYTGLSPGDYRRNN